MTGIRIEREDQILIITLDRPEVLNALNPAGHEALDNAFDAYRDDPDLRVAILTGAGDRAFCVGTDLKERAESNADHHPPTGFAGLTHRFDLDKPVIAAVNGLAIGGGVEIVLACDIAIASEGAAFQLPEPRIGLAAIGGGGLQRLARQIPIKHAMDMILTGRRISAAEAREFGLVSRTVPGDQLQAAARGLAQDILKGSPMAVSTSRRVALEALDAPDMRAALTRHWPEIDALFASEDAIEGQRAFGEKRPPIWKGR